MMSRVTKGMIAGFAAASAVAALEVVQLMAGPWVVSFPRLLTVALGADGVAWTGWAAHFVVGTFVLGPLFGILCPRMPGETPETKGMAFAIGAFVLMSLTLAPLAGVGLFGLRAGFPSLAWLIAMHAAFGAVMGFVYGRMVGRDWRVHHARDDIHLAH
jgi:hypothetical protein